MEPYEKLRKIRKERQWTQEKFAEKLGMTLNGYAKIERGETNLFNKNLPHIVDILGVDLIELLQEEKFKSSFVRMGDHYSNNHISNIVNASADIALELKRVQMINQHQEEMLKQKEIEIKNLNEIIKLLQTR
jgi:transcriptional regulator with XRE-family HTH domain